MRYTVLGRTGLKVSRLGFGAMRLPMAGDKVDRDKAVPMIRRAFEMGVTYIDSAVGYCNSDSEKCVGEALKGWRDRVTVSTKNHYFGENESEWRTNLENSLKRLDVDCIDIYNTHGINLKLMKDAIRPRILKWLEKAQDEGVIKHICTSFHDNNEAMRKIVDSGIFSSFTVQYNMLDRQLEDAMSYAHENNLGVVVMGPVAGGRLGASSDVLSGLVPGIERVPELALRFVLSNPNVTVALSGMSDIQQVEENIKTASLDTPLSSDETKLINEQLNRLQKMKDLYCTGCGYCKPCPKGVDIPRVFGIYNNFKVYGLKDLARRAYTNWKKDIKEDNKQADACMECGECEKKCPQKIAIRKQLKEAHKALSGE